MHVLACLMWCAAGVFGLVRHHVLAASGGCCYFYLHVDHQCTLRAWGGAAHGLHANDGACPTDCTVAEEHA